MAKNAIKRLRTIRYPNILKFLDTTEHQGTLYLVVEPVEPLSNTLTLWAQGKGRDASSSAWIAWGLSHIAGTLAFFHQNMQAIHGNVHPGSVFVAPSGEWLLGGMETLGSPIEPGSIIMRYGGLPPHANNYTPPELARAGWGTISQSSIHAVDSYGLCLLAIEAYNGSLPSNMSNFPAGRIPASLYTLLRRMANPRPELRLSPADMLHLGSQPNGFLSTNVLVQANQILEDFRVAHAVDKGGILSQLLCFQEQLSPSFSQFKVLPALVETFRYKNGSREVDLEFSASALLPLMLRIGEKMDSVSWNHVLGESILGAMGSSFQPIRMVLIADVCYYAHQLDTRAVSHQLWPLVWKSFQSALDTQRQAALESIRLLIPKFSERILNNELLRELAKMQKDVRPAHRLQATKLLSELSPRLNARTKADVLIPAFACSLKDAYDETRLAGITAFRENSDNFDASTSACQLIPALSPCLVDANLKVREAASETLHFYLEKITQYTQSMSSVSVEMPQSIPGDMDPQTLLSGERMSEKEGSRSTFTSFLSATAGSAATALSEWAISQIEDDQLASQMTRSLDETSKAKSFSAQSTPEISTPPAVPFHSNKGMSLSPSVSKVEKITHEIMQPAPTSTKPIIPKLHQSSAQPREASPLTQPPVMDTSASREVTDVQDLCQVPPKPISAAAPPSHDFKSSTKPTGAAASKPAPNIYSTIPASKSLSKEEKMAQLNKLREERRAVSIRFLLIIAANHPTQVPVKALNVKYVLLQLFKDCRRVNSDSCIDD